MSDDSTQAVVAGEAPMEPGNAAAKVSAAANDGKSAEVMAADDAGEEPVKIGMEAEKGADAEKPADADTDMNGTADHETEAPAAGTQPSEQNGKTENYRAPAREDRDRKEDRSERRDRDHGRIRDKDRREKDRKERHRDRDEKDSRRDRDDRKRSDRDRETSSRKRDRERERSATRDRDRDRDRSKSDRRDKEKRSSKHRSRSKDRSRRHSSRDDRKSRHRSRSKERSSSHRRRRHRSEEDESSEDEFGGYVPRKRQEIPRASKIKPATATPGYSTAYIDPYAALRSKTLAPADPEELARTMQEQQLKARQLVLQQQAASAVAAASKTQREVYVGNLMAGLVTEDALRQLFNSTMRAAFPAQCPPGMEPVVSVSLHSEGRYAFVELRTPEMASAALQLSNQVQLLGQSISVGRPSGYVDPSRAQEAAQAAAAALQAFQAGDMQTMEAQLEQANLGVTASPAAALPSPAAAGQVLPGPPPLAPGPAPAALPMGAPMQMAPSVEPAAATPYLEVNGMVTPEVLMDDEEYKEVIQDLHEECGKYGQLARVIVPRPPVPASAMELFGSNNYGKAFAEFTDAGSCAAAKAAIHGRMFAGETIRAQYVTQQYFAQLPQ